MRKWPASTRDELGYKTIGPRDVSWTFGKKSLGHRGCTTNYITAPCGIRIQYGPKFLELGQNANFSLMQFGYTSGIKLIWQSLHNTAKTLEP